MGENNHQAKGKLPEKWIWGLQGRHDIKGRVCSASSAPSVRAPGVPLEAPPVLSLLQPQKGFCDTGPAHQLV